MFNEFPRIIPVLLLKNKGLYKGQQFKNHSYIGDPINTVKIFNDKEADELLIFDITASLNNIKPSYQILESMAGECFMPLSYGGGIDSLKIIEKIIKLGVEKIYINTAAIVNQSLVREAVKEFGTSTICCCIDYKTDFFKKNRVYVYSGTKKTKYNPIEWAKKLEDLGVGEIILNSISRDGTQTGFDFDYFNQLFKIVKIPLIISGGCSGIENIRGSIKKKINNMAVGSSFVYRGKHRAVLITYPDSNELGYEK